MGGKRRSGSRRLVIVAGAVVALTAAVVAFGVLASGEDGGERRAGPAKATPPAWTREAGRLLAASPGLRYDGTVSVNGRPLQVMLKVTPSGLATGTLSAGGTQADLVAVGGSTYVKGGPVFWQSYSGEAARAGSFAGRWARLPAAIPGLADVEDVLSPEAIAAALSKAPGTATTENAGATPAYRVKTSKADYFVTASAPYRLVRVHTAGQGDPRFTVAPLADPVLAIKEMRPRVAALGGAADPALRFQPARPEFVNCTDNLSGCTLSVPATLTAPEGKVPEGARAALRATITADGRTLGACAGSRALAADRKVTLRCKVATRGWRTWMRGVREAPGSHPYEGHAQVIGEAVAASDVARLLGLVDRERAEKVTASPSAAPGSVPGPSQGSSPGSSPAGPPASPSAANSP